MGRSLNYSFKAIYNMLNPKTSIFLIFILFTSVCANSQDISGIYRWDLDSGRRTFTIYLEAENSIPNDVPTSFKGEHCGVFESGRRMDCSYDSSSVFLKKISENVFEGTILSAYSLAVSEIKVTYFPKTKSLRWEVTKEGKGKNLLPKYFPNDVIMKSD
jgi:hypothetical protein